MTAVSTLYVAWRSPRTRAIYPVGRLRQHDRSPQFEFAYIAGAQEAQPHGFQHFWNMPELDQVYLSDELFPLFSNRLMSGSRPDYSDYVARLGLQPSSAGPFDILSRSGGLRPDDKLEFFAPPLRLEQTDRLQWHFLVRGVRYMPGSEDRIKLLEPGERLRLMLDCQNEFDPLAVALRTDDHCLLGYMPMYFAADIKQLFEVHRELAVTVAKINLPPAPLHHRVLCVLEGPWPSGFQPFSTERYRPLAQAPQSA